ncbi:hypothetical protein BMF89_01960 [Arthrobacter sp. SRS-W-1-2016]|uniref:hypothetical protein n=1 Tax=Arthrobacter sp. SRS-W-1-2016 TaxID=1930254 RepID=UPI000990BED9|nr:hypothetical protein [Arthrobacter sp. SRS-W-1-2016]OOP64922.1 hypothetical protein BMF89_01960 [Arthrobacter sp. SRS-W-1-2016]
MTTNDFRSAEEVHDRQIVEDLLAETGMDPADAGELKPALMHVRGVAHGPRPIPRGEFAALLASLDTGPTMAPETGTLSSLETRRRKRHTRLVIAATALSLTVGAGAAAAAVNPDFRDTVQKTVTTLINTLTSTPNDRPPGTPGPVDSPAPATSGQPTPPGKAVPGGPTATPRASSVPHRDETVPGPQTNSGRHGPPVTEHPAHPAPVMPQPAVPAPAPPVPASAPATPVPAPAPGSQTTSHPGRP